jgi:RimJ/RimL family protein N-acetyltransferase
VTTLRTERLELRPLDERDLDALVELDAFEEVRSAIDPFSEHIPADPAERREYERRFLHPSGFLAAIDRATGRFLGWFQLQDERGLAPGAQADPARAAAAARTELPARTEVPARTELPARTEVEIGYRLRPDAWGQGFATEGAAALLADALERPGVVRVYAHALHSNPGSIRVMEKIGMTYAGPWSYRGLEGAEYEALPGIWRAVPGT